MWVVMVVVSALSLVQHRPMTMLPPRSTPGYMQANTDFEASCPVQVASTFPVPDPNHYCYV